MTCYKLIIRSCDFYSGLIASTVFWVIHLVIWMNFSWVSADDTYFRKFTTRVVGRLSNYGENSPRRFIRWFWNFLREEKAFLSVSLLKRCVLNCFFKLNSTFLVTTDLLSFLAKNITEYSISRSRFFEIQFFKIEYFLGYIVYTTKQKIFNQNKTYKWPREQKAFSLTIGARFSYCYGKTIHGFGVS